MRREVDVALLMRLVCRPDDETGSECRSIGSQGALTRLWTP